MPLTIGLIGSLSRILFLMLATNLWWEVHLTVLATWTSRPLSCSLAQMPPETTASSVCWSTGGGYGIDLSGWTTHFRFTAAYLWEKYRANLWLKTPGNAGPAGETAEGLCHPQHLNVEHNLSVSSQHDQKTVSDQGLHLLPEFLQLVDFVVLALFSFFLRGKRGLAWPERVAVTIAI